MFEAPQSVVGRVLRERGNVPAGRLAELVAQAEQEGVPLAELALRENLLPPDELGRGLAEAMGLSVLAPAAPGPSAAVAALVPAEVSRRFGVVPYRLDGPVLQVVAQDPFDPALSPALAAALGREVRVVVAAPAVAKDWLQQHLARERPRPAPGAEGAPVVVAEDLADDHSGPAVVRLVNGVLRQAIADGASDIHFEPFEEELKIRYRIDGALYELSPVPAHLILPVTSRLKVLAHLDIAERRVAQDGRIHVAAQGRRVDLRVATLPTQFGESVVLRVLDPATVQLALEDLGLPRELQEALRAAIHRPNGLVVVTGPTGSGKTTTLYALLRQLNQVSRKILTAEDPVEYELDGVMQTSVNPSAGLSFPVALRSFLRQDPDVVMVGEMRDGETARTAVQAALTGHLVLSTLHTQDAASAVARLIDLGVEPYLVGSTLTGVLAQRLVRRTCECRSWSTGPAGCPRCHDSGYRGRLGLFEWLGVDAEVREAIGSGASAGQLRELRRRRGGTALAAAGAAAVAAGLTTAEEVARHCGERS